MLLRPILSRLHKHQSFANFCILKNVEISSATTSPGNANSPSTSKEKSLEKEYVISYLVNSSGLSSAMAISASKKVHFDSPDKANAVLDFLEKRGFSKTQFAKMVARLPRILVSDPKKYLSPKIEFFLQSGAISEKDVLTIVSRNPDLLTRSPEKLSLVYDYIKNIIGAEKIGTLLRRGSWIFHVELENKLIPNVDFLGELGVPRQFLEFALYNFPEIFCSKHVDFREIVGDVKQMGFDPLKSSFVAAIHARAGERNIALWDRCTEVYSKWGWSKDDILMALRKHPGCMLLSEKKISTVLDFLVNKVGREPRSVARCPYILLLSLENRIVPRCSVVHLLSSNGLVKKDWSLISVLCPGEKKFLLNYVARYSEELPQLYDIYLSKKMGVVEA